MIPSGKYSEHPERHGPRGSAVMVLIAVAVIATLASGGWLIWMEL